MKPAAYPRQNRSPSFHNDTSPCSSTAPNDLFISQKMDYIEQFLSKFDDRLAKLEVTAKSPSDDKSFSSQKKSTEGSCLEFDHKLRAVEDGLFLTKNETSKRLSTLEDHIRDLAKKAVHGMHGLPPSRSNSDVSKQGDYSVNDRISGIERRVDGMDRRLEQLTASLETFMQRIEGNLGAGQVRQEGRREIRQQSRQGEEDRLTEVRLLGSGSTSKREEEGQSRFEESYQRQKRGTSRDVVDTRDRIRDIPDQSGRFREEIVSPEKPVERVERVERYEETRKFIDVRTPAREQVEQFERKRDEGKYNERHVERPAALDLRPPVRDTLRDTKGSLKSPDTERKRKNVSWIESSLPSEGNVEESMNKRTKVETSEDEVENLGRSSLNQSVNRERPRSAIKPRERVEENKYKYGAQRTPSAVREEGTGYMRYSGEFRREKAEERSERTEERNVERVESEKGGDKERMMEEKRKKIDEEIERRISKQIELKKKADVAVEGQRKIYEKASQIEDDFKISPYSTEKSRDKEVVSRLVREKQMRSDLISKYSENAPESGRKSKSPLRK